MLDGSPQHLQLFARLQRTIFAQGPQHDQPAHARIQHRVQVFHGRVQVQRLIGVEVRHDQVVDPCQARRLRGDLVHARRAAELRHREDDLVLGHRRREEGHAVEGEDDAPAHGERAAREPRPRGPRGHGDPVGRREPHHRGDLRRRPRAHDRLGVEPEVLGLVAPVGLAVLGRGEDPGGPAGPAQRLDDEQQLLIDDALFTARTLITENRDLLDRIELHYLANPDDNLHFAVLTDFADAPADHRGEAVLAVAARVGTTRLIDNVSVTIGEGDPR